MSQDLRDLFKRDGGKDLPKLKQGHEDRFLKRLESELPIDRKSSFSTLKAAAAVAVLVGVGLYLLVPGDKRPASTETVDTTDATEKVKTLSLGDLSPDLRKVEDYYVSTINLELSRLELTKANKGLVDSYLEQLSELNGEYHRLNLELNEIGPNDQTINALIKNLQLRLRLLNNLKSKISELKSSENEQEDII